MNKRLADPALMALPFNLNYLHAKQSEIDALNNTINNNAFNNNKLSLLSNSRPISNNNCNAIIDTSTSRNTSPIPSIVQENIFDDRSSDDNSMQTDSSCTDENSQSSKSTKESLEVRRKRWWRTAQVIVYI